MSKVLVGVKTPLNRRIKNVALRWTSVLLVVVALWLTVVVQQSEPTTGNDSYHSINGQYVNFRGSYLE